MHAVVAALGWVLAVFFFVQLVRASRMLRQSRWHLEALLRLHRPDTYTRYVSALAARGQKPLTQSTKEP